MRKDVAYMLIIATVAVLLRVALGVASPYIFDDSRDYLTLASQIRAGEAYEVNGLQASRMPGYPYFLAAIQSISGNRVGPVLVIQSFLGGAVVALTFLLAQPLGPRVALLAALFAAIDPLSIGFSAAVLTETLYTCLLLLGLWCAWRLLQGEKFLGWITLGLVWALGVYVRASALWCIVPVGAWIVIHTWGGNRAMLRRQVLGFMASVFVLLAALSPWMIRNLMLFGEQWKFHQLTTLEGISLYESVYKDATGGPRQDKIALPPDMRGLDEAARDREWRKRAWSEIKSDPLRIAKLAIIKMARTWSPSLNADEFQRPLLRWGMFAWYLPLFLLAIVGLFRARFPLVLAGLLLAPILYYTAVHAVYLGSVRYRVPLMPLVCIFAAWGALWLWSKRPQAQRV